MALLAFPSGILTPSVTRFYILIFIYIYIHIQLCALHSALMSPMQESDDLRKKEFVSEGIFGLCAKEYVSPGKMQALHI